VPPSAASLRAEGFFEAEGRTVAKVGPHGTEYQEVKIASWNVNSVRFRLNTMRRFLRRYEPDVLCLQETKVADPLFPHAAAAALGYEHQFVAGQKGYNGVAILSREPLEDARVRNWCGRADARHVFARVRGIELHNVYAPAGGDLPDPARNAKFRHKLEFYRALTRWFRGRHRRRRFTTGRVVLAGDLNIAPLENDVWSHRALARTVTHTDVERRALGRLYAACDWVDALRFFVPESEKLFTWWSYRAPNWRRVNKGRRLDHIWVSSSLSGALRSARVIDRVRGWNKPSDHAPLLIELEG
jgi:exodeoxyribonuclease-3